MDTTSLDKLKNALEINGGGLFFSLLKDTENHHFFRDKVKKTEKAHFTPDIATIRWASDYYLTTLTNTEGFTFDEVITDVCIAGELSECNSKGKDISRHRLQFDFTVQAYVFHDSFSVNREHIKLLNPEQKITLLFHKNYQREIDRLAVPMLFEKTFQGGDAFSFFTRIWKHVDRQKPTLVNDTSHDYFDELIECQRNILYSVAMSNIWGRYIVTYGTEYYYFQGTRVYPLKLDYRDNRFIFYLENAIEELYTYYERLAYLLFLFLTPANLTPTALSFSKLFERKIKKELKQKFPGLANDINFIWFEKPFSKEHKVLSGYRHPLVHYQTTNNFIKGGYNASLKRIWLANASGGEAELKQLTTDIRAIHKFINSELPKCAEAFERTILLIEQLPVNALTIAGGN